MGSKNFEGPSIAASIENLIDKGHQDDVALLFQHWKQTLEKEQKIRTPENLYSGSLWNASVEAFNEIQGEKHLWIISCGYGLISDNERISGYKATFKNRELDSICDKQYFRILNDIDVKRQWWNLLTNKGVIDTGKIKHIHEIINRSEPTDIILIAAGKDYHEAIYNDLAKVNIDKVLPTIVILGIKKEDDYLKPAVPKVLESFVIPYFDGGVLMRFLKVNLGSCNKVQLNSKFATWIIREYNRTGAFPRKAIAASEVVRPYQNKEITTVCRDPRPSKTKKSTNYQPTFDSSGKYTPLEQYLSKSEKETLELEFSKIEAILGFKLPESAYKHGAWWSNGGHKHSNSWLNAGYVVMKYKFGDYVLFKRAINIDENKS
ncbi:MAG: hypothetical protein Q7J68_04445 [Thermoplasmata archaeon]|nr:hypothetical protein [Thermoplasmata archaeon]